MEIICTATIPSGDLEVNYEPNVWKLSNYLQFCTCLDTFYGDFCCVDLVMEPSFPTLKYKKSEHMHVMVKKIRHMKLDQVLP